MIEIDGQFLKVITIGCIRVVEFDDVIVSDGEQAPAQLFLKTIQNKRINKSLTTSLFGRD